MAKEGDSGAGPHFRHETALTRLHGGTVAGIDEAGRGPWAGPVVAAAVILDHRNIPVGLNDSKKLSEERREELFEEILQSATVGVGVADVARIDRDNILNATLWAMEEACRALSNPPAAILVDGNRCPQSLPCPAQSIVKGDAISLSVAAASIVAKVTRDTTMRELCATHPHYGWSRNKGYGTREHAAALERLGVTAHHRRSFRPIRELLERSA